MKIALKEWAVVCNALAAGTQIILLRKGGIYEAAGEFEVEHAEFLLFPTYLHQDREMVKPNLRDAVDKRVTEPGEIIISAAGVVTDIIQLQSRQQMDRLENQHIWTPPLIDMRFNYRPENPLYLLLIRAYRLEVPQLIVNTPAYAGCKSWVPLEPPVDILRTAPALDEQEFQKARDQIIRLIN
jgi:hypothetical protein